MRGRATLTTSTTLDLLGGWDGCCWGIITHDALEDDLVVDLYTAWAEELRESGQTNTVSKQRNIPSTIKTCQALCILLHQARERNLKGPGNFYKFGKLQRKGLQSEGNLLVNILTTALTLGNAILKNSTGWTRLLSHAPVPDLNDCWKQMQPYQVQCWYSLPLSIARLYGVVDITAVANACSSVGGEFRTWRDGQYWSRVLPHP